MIGNTVFRQPGDLLQPTTPEFISRDFPGFKIQSGYAMVWPGMTAEETGLDDLQVYQENRGGFAITRSMTWRSVPTAT
jgi:hypothetical protein